MGTRKLKFDYLGFKSTITGKRFIYKQIFTPIRAIDPRALSQMAKSYDKFIIKNTFEELRARLSTEYFYQMYPAQCASMSFSKAAFPPYRFILPDVLTEDWLALIDYHKDFSRDHSIHQPLSAYIVHLLLGGGDESRALFINGKSILTMAVDNLLDGEQIEYLRVYLGQMMPNSRLLKKDKVSRQLWKDIFYETAITAALFHDTGYPWQYIGNLKNSIGKNDFNLPIEDLNAHHIYQAFQSRLVMFPFWGYTNPVVNSLAGWDHKIHELIKDSVCNTHGFPGALGFLYLNDMVRKSPSPKGEEMALFCIDWAALGIMMHDMKKIYQGGSKTSPRNPFLRLDFEQDPLSCIVAIADLLEDFYRPSASFKKDANDNVNIDYNIAATATELEVNGNSMKITFHFGSSNLARAQSKFKQDEVSEYFDPMVGYINISSLGLQNVSCSCVV